MLKAIVRRGASKRATMRPSSRKRVKAAPRLSVFPSIRPRRWLSCAIALLGTWRRSRERVELVALTDRELRDIGLTRCDALFDSTKWFWRA
jgi:uncharacterized protein YjiS (DUF1127 family)